MARYAKGFQSAAAAAGAAYFEFRPGARMVQIRELGVSCNAATASSIGLGQPGNTPAGGTPSLGAPLDRNAQAAVGGVVTSGWTTAPTAPSIYVRQLILPATIGAGVIWTFPEPVEINASAAGLILWNFGAAAGSVLSAYIEWDE